MANIEIKEYVGHKPSEVKNEQDKVTKAKVKSTKKKDTDIATKKGDK